jgi:lipooligosaccharide transport system permease protein
VTSIATGARVVPRIYLGRGAQYVFERNLRVYRHTWIIIFSGFFESLFYLFATKTGIGGLVGSVNDGSGHLVSYATFVAPALLAASAMNGAVFESTMNIFFKLKYAKTYDAMLSTPLAPMDIALGEIGWCLMRGLIYAAAFLVVMQLLGLIASPLAILALPAAVLIGSAFAATGMAATSFMKSWQDFDLVTLFTLVLFLFSATFYPLTVYPGWLQAVTQLSPLYHGVVLLRAFTLGHLTPVLIWHALFLAVQAVAGLAIAAHRLKILLTP